MDHKAILEKVIAVTGETLDVDAGTLTEETDFKQLGADSYDLLELVTAFEDELGATMDDEVLDRITTIGDAVSIIEKAQ